MNTEGYKNKRKGQPKRSSKVKGSKRHVAAKNKEVASKQPHLQTVYNAKVEWVKKVIPPAKE